MLTLWVDGWLAGDYTAPPDGLASRYKLTVALCVMAGGWIDQSGMKNDLHLLASRYAIATFAAAAAADDDKQAGQVNECSGRGRYCWWATRRWVGKEGWWGGNCLGVTCMIVKEHNTIWLESEQKKGWHLCAHEKRLNILLPDVNNRSVTSDLIHRVPGCSYMSCELRVLIAQDTWWEWVPQSNGCCCSFIIRK